MPVQTALAGAGIPHRVLGSLGLYERSEVRDALAYLTLIANPADAQAFRRAVATPRRGVGERTAGQLVARARERHDGDLIAASANAGTLGEIGSRKAREQLERFGDGLRAGPRRARGRPLARTRGDRRGDAPGRAGRPPPAADRALRRRRRSVATRSGCSRTSARCAAPCRPTRSASDSPTLTGFLEHARGLHARELTPGQDRRITVSTIHRAKGTEARVVILAGCEERLLPSWRSLEAPEQLQEERRLFYVACTRAKDRLYMTHAGTRGGRETAGPSRFPDRGRAAGGRAVSAGLRGHQRYGLYAMSAAEALLKERSRMAARTTASPRAERARQPVRHQDRRRSSR